MAFGLDDIIAQGLSIINKFIPDPEAKQQANLEMLKIRQADDFKQIDAALQQMQMQADINKVEAGNSSRFVSGWRPAVGWIAALGCGMQWVFGPLAVWIGGMFGYHVAYPELSSDQMYSLLIGLLGLGGMHTFENVKNGSSANTK